MTDFIKHSKLYAIISSVVIIAGLISMLTWGFKPSIDFVGGTNLEYQFKPQVSSEALGAQLEAGKVEVQELRQAGNAYVIRAKTLDEQQELKLRNTLEQNLKSKITVLRSETVGPVIGAETVRKTAIATAIAVLGILLYVAYAFRNFNFAIAAIAALLHDILVVVGTYSILSHFFPAELDTLFITALLTTMSFSVHDTIVVFDQIREYQKRKGQGNITDYANQALTDTMVRSLNNSLTIIFMLVALVLLGGSTIRYFALTLLIGTITGTYSSPFVATPIAVWLEKRKK
ncbi:MAG: protein translocase subunit SecF [Weeksellaceae bacterium]